MSSLCQYNKQKNKQTKNRSWSVLLKTASLISQVSSSAKLITGGGNGLSVCEEGAQEGAREARLNS